MVSSLRVPASRTSGSPQRSARHPRRRGPSIERRCHCIHAQADGRRARTRVLIPAPGATDQIAPAAKQDERRDERHQPQAHEEIPAHPLEDRLAQFNHRFVPDSPRDSMDRTHLVHALLGYTSRIPCQSRAPGSMGTDRGHREDDQEAASRKHVRTPFSPVNRAGAK